MTERQEELVPEFEGPDPCTWPESVPRLWNSVLNIEALNRTIEAVGPFKPEEDPLLAAGREFLHHARADERAALAQMILAAYKVPVPEPTEAVGGFSGDGNGEGAGDHLRRVQG